MEERCNNLREKLAMAKCIASDFRENTSIDAIVREYESRLKELEKKRKK